MPKILIRADASYSIGTGHIHRTLVLAKKFRHYGYCVSYACVDFDGNLISYIQDEGFDVFTLKDLSEEPLIDILSTEPYDLLVIDSYQISVNTERALRKRTKTPLLCFDDEGNPHNCNYLLNQNLYADTLEYSASNKDIKLFCGSEYALLRDEFSNPKPSTDNHQKPSILLTMGGSDPKAYTVFLLQLIAQLSSSYYTTVIAGKSNPKQSEIKAFCEQHPERFHCIPHTDNMALHINNAGFIISACGSTVLELLYLRKKFLAVVTADNQKLIAQYLQTHELASTISNMDKLSVSHLEKILIDTKVPPLCKIATKNVVLNVITDLQDIRLKKCTPKDSDFLFKLANDKTVREASLNTGPISASEHADWFDKKMQDPKCNIYILYKGSTPLATLRTQEKGHFITLSLAVEKTYRSKKYANILLGLYFDSPMTKSHLALVKRDNLSSNKLFVSNRFTLKRQCENLNFYTRQAYANS